VVSGRAGAWKRVCAGGLDPCFWACPRPSKRDGRGRGCDMGVAEESKPLAEMTPWAGFRAFSGCRAARYVAMGRSSRASGGETGRDAQCDGNDGELHATKDDSGAFEHR
jgi:hypothetical protein